MGSMHDRARCEHHKISWVALQFYNATRPRSVEGGGGERDDA